MNRLTAASLTLSALSAMTIIGASTADAHTGRLVGSAECTSSGWSATFTATNTQVDQSMTADGFGTIAPGSTGSKVISLSAAIPSVSVAGYFTFSDGFTDPYSLTVVAPTGCQTPTTVAITTTTTVPTATTQPSTTTVAPTSSTTPPATSSRFTVTTAAAPVPTLPETGASSAPLAAGGVVLVGLGAALVMFARKRSDA